MTKKEFKNYYAYKGDSYIAEGKASELAKRLDCKTRTIYRYSQPTYLNTCKPSAVRVYRSED